MDKSELTADILSDILQIHADRINAYKKALSKSKKLGLDVKSIFERMINESMKFKTDLNNKLKESETTVSLVPTSPQKGHNDWIGIKAILTGDRGSILTGCEHDEEVVGDAYITALSSENPLDSGIGQLLVSQLESSEVLRHQIKKYRDAE